MLSEVSARDWLAPTLWVRQCIMAGNGAEEIHSLHELEKKERGGRSQDPTVPSEGTPPVTQMPPIRPCILKGSVPPKSQ